MILMDCNNAALGGIITVLKNILNIIWMVGPILAIVSLIINNTSMMRGYNDSRTAKKIRNSIIALFILFFIPSIVNAGMLLLGNNYEISACWNSSNNVSFNSSYIDSSPNNNSTINIADPNDYENGKKKKSNSSTASKNNTGNVNTNFDLNHAINVHDNIHYKENSSLPWQNHKVGNYGGDIGAYTEAVNILNGTDYRIYEVYNVIVSKHPDIKTSQKALYKLTDVNDYYNIKAKTVPFNISEIDKALQSNKLVHGMSDSNSWTNSKGKHVEWKGGHNGLIFYYDGKYYHMKAAGAINQKDSIYTKDQLQKWINGAMSKRIITYEKK